MTAPLVHGELALVEFEVDDQTPEDLSIGLDRLREIAAIYDVLHMPAYGKKGRLTIHIRILADPVRLQEVITACFLQTTTIGLRHYLVATTALARQVSEIDAQGTTVRVKLVERPGFGFTGKAEAADVIIVGEGHAQRAALRDIAQREAIRRDGEGAGSTSLATPPHG